MMGNFSDAVTRLNSRNLVTLLRTSSILSAVEIFLSDGSPTYPLLNMEKCRLFTEAVLSSKAALYKQNSLTHADLIYVINASSEALYDPRIQTDIPNRQERSLMLYKVQLFFSRMANLQIRQQEFQIKSLLGRTVGLLEYLPERDSAEWPDSWRKRYGSFQHQLQSKWGCTLWDLAVVYQIIVIHYQCLAASAITLADNNPYPTRDEVRTLPRQNWPQAVAMHSIVYNLEGFGPYLDFSAEDLAKMAPDLTDLRSVKRFLGLFSASIKDLRAKYKEPAHQFGTTGWRLSPLERHPIVRFSPREGKSDRYIVPNCRTFLRSFSEVIHFALQDDFGSDYNLFRGFALEHYIHTLLQQELKGLTVIPEPVYMTSQGEYRGPDLTVIDFANQDLILIEIKARRTLAETRFTMGEELIDSNYDPIFKALRKCEEKAGHILGGLGVFSQYANVLAEFSKPPICVAILAESVYFLNEIIRYRTENTPGHRMAGFPWPFCILGLESFELAVAASKQLGTPLGTLLREAFEDGADMELSSRPSEQFRGRGLDIQERFPDSLYYDIASRKGFKEGSGDLKVEAKNA